MKKEEKVLEQLNEDNENKKSQQSEVLKLAEEQGFVDPISGLIMTEPVIFGDEKKYEKELLKYWLEQGKKTSPLTNIELETIRVVPAQLHRERIREFLKKYPHLIIENHVYLPREYLEDFAAAIKNKDIEKITKRANEDVRLIYVSAQQAIEKCGTKYRDQSEASDRSGFHLACEVANLDIVMQMVKILESKKIPLNFISNEKPPEWNPTVLNQALYSALGEENNQECGKLLFLGADANFTGKKGNLLHRAVKKQKKEIVGWLLAYGAKINAQSDKFYQQTPLHVVVESGNLEIAKILLENGANTEIKAEKKSGSNFIGDRSLPLHIACRNGNESMVKLLLEHGANIEGKDNYGNHKDVTPLIWTSARGHVAIVKLLLKSGANVDTKDSSGWTPLHWAVREGQLEIIKVLMEQGADHKAEDREGITPIEVARRRKDGGKEIVNLIPELHRKRKLKSIERIKELEKQIQELQKEREKQQEYNEKLESRIGQLENLVPKPIVDSQLTRSQSSSASPSTTMFFETPQSSENNRQLTAVPKQEINTEDDQENLQETIQASLKQAEEDEVKRPSTVPNKHF